VAAFGIEKIQNDGRCHGNQGAKNVKFTPSFTNFCSNVSYQPLRAQLHMAYDIPPRFHKV
jgi:hypothetical protein